MITKKGLACGFSVIAFALAAVMSGPALAAQTTVAVAANFTQAATDIAAAFEKKTGDRAVLSFGSTGKLYNQIAQSAPFDVFLAADTKRPKKAVTEGHGVKGTVSTYAIGKIVLWSARTGVVNGKKTLDDAGFDKIAIANPKTAPYGAAAVEAMTHLGVYKTLKPKIVKGNNIAQTFQFVSTGNAELGFVALSEIAGSEKGSRWVVPSNLYAPIRQDVVLLEHGKDNATAKAFVKFLKGPAAAKIIREYGYAVGKDE